eukprot:c36941_g1_i1 orf=97-315(+)
MSPVFCFLKLHFTCYDAFLKYLPTPTSKLKQNYPQLASILTSWPCDTSIELTLLVCAYEFNNVFSRTAEGRH